MRIAVVDASRVVLKIVSFVLTKAGHDVVGFSSAALALERLRATPVIDVLVTSLQFEGLSGADLVRQARASAGHLRPLYIVVMSSSLDGATLVEALDSGADDFIGKPPAEPELLARLRVAERALDLQNELIRLATTDAMTGALNRRAFFDTAATFNRSASDAIAIFDIDRFKTINDRFGHAAGDRVIVEVARAVLARVPHVGRIGGEEFAALLPGETLKDAFDLCETLRADVAKLAFRDIDRSLAPTCSFGVASWRASETAAESLMRADAALYEAKSAGRDRVVAAHDGGLSVV